jgi:IS5 family transposase
MKPSRRPLSGPDDLFRSQLENIIDMRHELVRLGAAIEWRFFEEAFDAFYSEEGRPGIPTRMMVGLHILKHMFDLSDEGVCERWVYDPYFQHFCGEAYFQHALPIDRSSLTRWRERIGAEGLAKVFQESLGVAHRVGALRAKDLRRVTVDTTVQPKNITFPTDAKLMHGAIVKLGRLAKRHQVPLRQSYVRVAKRAALMAGRYAHAKQFKRHQREMRFLRTRLGRLVRDIGRKTDDDEELTAVFATPLARADQVRRQRQRQRGWKLYSLHAPEVECIGKGKAHRPYEFGCKVSVATTNARAPGGQFVTHIKALHGNPYDGHTLGPVIKEMEAWTGITPERIYVDKGYAGHNHPKKFRVWRSGQKRGLTPTIKKELRRRSAIEAVIGHMKTDGRLDRNFLKGREGDRINAILVGAGYNYRLVLKWLRLLCAWIVFRLKRDLSKLLPLQSVFT